MWPVVQAIRASWKITTQSSADEAATKARLSRAVQCWLRRGLAGCEAVLSAVWVIGALIHVLGFSTGAGTAWFHPASPTRPLDFPD